jgi:hypothetical protein
MRALIISVLAIGCGRVGFDPTTDAGLGRGDAIALCAPGPWQITSHLDIAATAGNDWEPALSPNGLVLVWTTSATGPDHLYVATRSAVTDTFGSARLLSELWGQQMTDGAFGPLWSHDGDELYFTQVSTAGDTQMVALYRGGGAFGTPAPSGIPTTSTNAAFSADELELFYTVQIAADDFDLGHATRMTKTSPWVSDTLLDTFNRRGAAMREGWPSFDDARQELYIEYAVSGGTDAVGVIRRAAPGLPFEALAPVADLGPDGNDPDIAPDGMSLVFAANRTGGAGRSDLYMAARACE